MTEPRDRFPRSTLELGQILKENKALLQELDRELSARMDTSLTEQPVSKRLYETFLKDHDRLVASLKQIKDKKTLLDELVPYGPIFSVIASLEGLGYPTFYDPNLALAMQQDQFDFFRNRIIELLDAIMETPISDAIWSAAEKERRTRNRKR